MSENLNAALQITLIGMSFVLAALALLSLAMAALVRLTAERPAARPAPEVAPSPAPVAAAASQQHAAAVAVAVALAGVLGARPGVTTAAHPMPPPASAWQATMRARNLKQREQRR